MITVGSLCTGAGGLDMAADDALGPVRTAWVADPDAAATVVLRERLGVPNLGDITALDWTAVEPVDVITAGFPCQPYSLAGRREGHVDERAIWPAVADAIRVVRPRLFIGENVPGILARGQLGRVVADLARIGYVGSWLCLRASDTGAPHQRKRVFLAATDPHREPVRPEPEPVGARVGSAVAGDARPGDDDGVAVWRETVSRRGRPGEELIRAPRTPTLMPTPTASRAVRRGQPSPDVAATRYAQGRRMLDDAVALLPTPRATEGAKGGPNQRGSSGDLTLTSSVMLLPTPTAMDANASRNATANRSHIPATTNHTGWTLHDVAYADRWAQYSPAIARWEAVLGRPAPDPTVTGKRGGRRLSARFVEWLMGWPDGWVTELVDNTAALRLCGNGVVRQQGAAALRLLAGAS